MKPKPLGQGYSVAVDQTSRSDWYATVAAFDDGSLYQLWQDADGEGRRDVSRFILRRHDEVVAAAEVRLYALPFIRRGIAYVRWGPLWRLRGQSPEPEDFRQAIRALHNEYVCRRGLILRIVPRLFVEDDERSAIDLAREDFVTLSGRGDSRTLHVDISTDLDEIRKALDRRWRNHLSKAERASLTLNSGTAQELFDEFELLYREMLRRKRFAPTADLQKHRVLQEALPDDLKMSVVLARDEDRPCAGAIFSAIGDTALYLFGATNESGMRTSASYLVQWEVLKQLKARRIRNYDLHGINPEANPGTYEFKLGLAGKRGKEMTFLTQVQALEPSLVNSAVLAGERLRLKLMSL
jgi:hypothetical protein